MARLKAAFDDSQLKCLVLDTYWWSKEAQEACPACRCLPADVAASWDTWAAPMHLGMGRLPGGGATILAGTPMHTRASQHYAHLLRDACWGCTPPSAAAAVGPL